MDAAPPVRSSLFGILLQIGRLLALLVQNRVHLYSFLLLKIALFRLWVSGLAEEAQGSCRTQVHPPSGVTVCPLARALRPGLALLWAPMWLLLWGPKLLWAAWLGCVRSLSLGLQRLLARQQGAPSAATWRDLLLSCLHSVMLAILLLLLLSWRLFQKAHRFSLGWLPGQALLQNRAVLEPLALLRRLYWWVERTTAVTSWHLAYLVTWTTCLASHLLQAAFEHTAQLAQAQEAESQEASGPLLDTPLPEACTLEGWSGPLEPGTSGK